MTGRRAHTLIVVKDNKYGLTRDAALIAAALERLGIAARIVGIGERGLVDRLLGRRQARRAIHVERAFPAWFTAAEETWLVPNQERFPRRHLGRLAGVDRVLAKTRHAEAIFSALGADTRYLGFTSPDRHDAAVARDWHEFYHLAGASTLKGTQAVLDLWRAHPEWPTLHLVQKAANAPRSLPGNVDLVAGYLTDAALRTMQNRYGQHLCPSRAEGWGHHIVEALSCGALVVTTDAPPMNEHVTAETGLLVPACASAPRHLGTSYAVDPAALEAAIETLRAMPVATKQAMGAAARRAYEAIDRGFAARLEGLLADTPDAPALPQDTAAGAG